LKLRHSHGRRCSHLHDDVVARRRTCEMAGRREITRWSPPVSVMIPRAPLAGVETFSISATPLSPSRDKSNRESLTARARRAGFSRRSVWRERASRKGCSCFYARSAISLLITKPRTLVISPGYHTVNPLRLLASSLAYASARRPFRQTAKCATVLFQGSGSRVATAAVSIPRRCVAKRDSASRWE